MFHSELIESVYGGAQESALDGCEACALLLAGTLDYGLDYMQGD